MKTDPRLEEESETPEEDGLLHRLGQAVKARKLGFIDGAIGFFQHWRNSVEPPSDEDEDWRRGRGHGAAAASQPEAAPHGGGLRRFLIVLTLLLAAGFGGMLFSYSLFGDRLRSDEMVIDDLREELEQMQKADARSLSIQAKDQVQIAEQKKVIREYEARLEEYEDQIAQLRQQIAAAAPRPVHAPVRTPYAPPRPVPQKTGKCTAAGSSAAADIARCLEEFNRP